MDKFDHQKDLLSLNRIAALFPENFTDEQRARVQTLFYKELALEAHRFYGGKMQNILEVDIKGYKAELPVLPLPSGVKIAFFNLHGNTKMTKHCADELAKLLDGCEVLPTA